MTVQRRKDERENSEKKTKHYMFLVLTFLIVLMVGAMFHMISRPNVDIASGCELDKVIPTMVVIIDRTGEFTENHKRILKQSINKEVDNLAVDSRLQIYTIDDKIFKGASKPIIDICKPRSKNDINQLYENVSIENKKIDIFNNKLELAINTAFLGGDGSKSPIIEAIYDVISNSKTSDNVKIIKIILASDLIQNSDLISFYKKGLIDFENKKIALNGFPKLIDIDIDILYLQRQNKEGVIQTSEFLQWWENAFNIALVNSLKIHKVR